MIIDMKKPNAISLTTEIAVKYQIGYWIGESVPRKTWGAFVSARM
jgi:hypothetical protein